MTIVNTCPTDVRVEGVFICPGCDTLAVRWADLDNTRCGRCGDAH